MPASPPLAMGLFAVLIALLGASALVLSGYRFLVFHAAIELFCVVVGFSAFVVAWTARRFLDDNYLVLLGVGYFFVGVLDALHSLSYQGLGVFPGGGANVPLQFWIAAGALEAACFLIAVAGPHRRFPIPAAVAVCGGVTLLVVWSILGWRVFPVCADPVTGLTPFKIICEWLMALAALAALALLMRQRQEFDRRVFGYLAASCLFRAVSEVLVTGYTDLDGLTTGLGHVCKAAAFICVLRGIVETAVVRPLALTGKSLDRERRLSAEIERQAGTLRAVLAASPDPHFLVGRDLRFSCANTAAAGLAPDGAEPLCRQVAGVFADGGPATGEVALAGRHFEFRLVPLPEAAGPLVAVLAVLRDITDRIAADAALRRALEETEQARTIAEQADKAKSRFLAAASHDLRQPMQATRLFLEVLAGRLGNDANREVLDRAMEALSGSDALLKSLLDLSTLQADVVNVEIGPVAISVLFSRLLGECAPVAADKGLDLRVVSSDAVVRSDPVMLQRMLRNLLNNAIRYTSRGKVLLGGRRRGGHLLICVVDTGCGIPADQQELIFEEFYQVSRPGRSRAEGLGLGLSIVRRQARLLGHRLVVRSREGHGSMFAVSVPVSAEREPPAVPVAAVVPAAPVVTAGQAVLVVEDDPQQLTALTMVLESWGLTVRAAPGADEALARLGDGWRPALIVCDLRLPGRRSGIELIGEVRQRCGRAVPALLVTGDTDPHQFSEAADSGLTLVHKPFTLETLKDAVHRQLPPVLVSGIEE